MYIRLLDSRYAPLTLLSRHVTVIILLLFLLHLPLLILILILTAIASYTPFPALLFSFSFSPSHTLFFSLLSRVPYPPTRETSIRSLYIRSFISESSYRSLLSPPYYPLCSSRVSACLSVLSPCCTEISIRLYGHQFAIGLP